MYLGVLGFAWVCGPMNAKTREAYKNCPLSKLSAKQRSEVIGELVRRAFEEKYGMPATRVLTVPTTAPTAVPMAVPVAGTRVAVKASHGMKLRLRRPPQAN